MQLAQRVRLRFHLQTLSEQRDARRTSSIAWKSPAPATGRSSPQTLSRDLPLHRRRAAPRQHAVRHGDDGGVRRGPRSASRARTSRARSRNCSGSSSRTAAQPSRGRWPTAARHRSRRRRTTAGRARRPAPRTTAAPRRRPRRRWRACWWPPTAARCRSCRCDRARHRRPHRGQRPADRQPLRQPPPLPGHHHAALVRHRRPEQHQRHLREVQARAPSQPQRRRRGADRQARADLHR